MSNRDNFAGGFLAGAIFGSVVGGVLGALLVSNRNAEALPPDESPGKSRNHPLSPATERNIESARRGLEDKIAQLNDAIDDVRQQLGNVNGNLPLESSDPSFSQDP